MLGFLSRLTDLKNRYDATNMGVMFVASGTNAEHFNLHRAASWFIHTRIQRGCKLPITPECIVLHLNALRIG